MPCFLRLADHVFAGKLTALQRAEIMFADYDLDPSLLTSPLSCAWQKPGYFISGCAQSEEDFIAQADGMPCDLPVFTEIGFLGMILGGMSLLGGEVGMRGENASALRLTRLEKDGLPSLREISAEISRLSRLSQPECRYIASSMDGEMQRLLSRPSKALVISPANMLDMSQDPSTGVPRFGSGMTEWCVVHTECAEEGNLKEISGRSDVVFRSSDPGEVMSLIGDRTAVFWSSEDWESLKSMVGEDIKSAIPEFTVEVIEKTIMDIEGEYDWGIYQAAVEGTVSATPPSSRHELIASWTTLPAEWMFDLASMAGLYRDERDRLLAPASREAKKKLVGPGIHSLVTQS